ncbi:helix-turn-helix domain-containing protein [Stigmatella sp. ncwal1]|uniref:Helix-turn-helix domain-containing protein n=1 Tax=Stigmatella ashevillensis TaxID=2995309 RepID=A0ABT5D4V5_9BACT|nr:helix-turn-helix domain-containing protein [Stigmatella ashevillena]MDC0708704.1 helix-turn-helix domain-containing protein [Stigmatella ashevillena]
MSKQDVAPRVCSLASALEVVGEKWSLLILREVFYGVRRFEGIAHNTGAPRDVLTARLRKLSDGGVLRRVLYSERPQRSEYHLTEAGVELAPTLLTLLQWGQRWVPAGPRAGGAFEHDCGERLHAFLACQACGRAVTGGDLSLGGKPLAPPQEE